MRVDLIGVTIGVGAEHARLAAEAARRMQSLAGVPVRILSEEEFRRSGCRNPNHLKFRLFDLVDAENVLYFDADAFCIRPWSPSALAGGREWVAVRGFWFDERVRRLGEIYGFGEDTFSGGLFLCNRAHHERVLRLAESLQPVDDTFHGLCNPDEIAFATALKALRIPTRYLDRRYNWLQFGRGDLAEGAGVIVAHACDPEMRRRYLQGSDLDLAPAGPTEGGISPELAGRAFLYERVGHDKRPLQFREDGTIGEGGGDAERYFFSTAGGDTVVLGSAWDTTCRLSRDADGAWRGRWSRWERMPVTLAPHRAQVLLDWLAPQGRARPLVGVEVGVDRGETSALLLRGLPGLHLYLIDPWHASAIDATRTQAACDRAMARAAAATAFAAERRTLMPCGHERAAPFVPAGLDLVFLDADRSEEGTREAIALWWPKVAAGGLLSGHDYGHPDYPGVKAAVDAFARRRKLRVRTGPDMVWAYEAQS